MYTCISKAAIYRIMQLFVLLLLSHNGFAQQIPSPLSIEDAVEYAKMYNPRIHQAEANVEFEKAAKRRAWAPPKPELLLIYEGMPRGTYFDLYESRKIIFGQSIEFPLKNVYKIKRQSSLLERSAQELKLEKLKLTAEVKIAYYETLHAKEQYNLAQENLALSEDLMAKAKLRFDLGEVGSIDYRRAKLEKLLAENKVNSAEIDRKNAVEALILLLTGNPEISKRPLSDIELAGTLLYRPVNIGTLESRKQQLENHSRIQIAVKGREAAANALSLAKSSLLPDFNVVYSRENVQNVPGFWGIEVGVSLPLWFFWDQKAQIAEARALQKVSEWHKVHEENHLRSELETAVFALQEQEKQVQRFQNEILKEAQQVFELARVSYREGETSYIEVIFAQQSLIETRSEYLNLLAEYNKAVAKLELALGNPLH